MNVLIPRLDRESAKEVIAEIRAMSAAEVSNLLPREAERVRMAAVGGRRISDDELRSIRDSVAALAGEHGFPRDQRRLVDFDGRCALLLHEQLQLSPHEASHEEVWSYLSCCWLLDVAVWRFGSDADERRFLGNVNRNTFRRLWWRAHILGTGGETPFHGLGEDELVNIMERPTISGNPSLARAIVSAFAERLAADESLSGHRMHLMRDVMKRLVRLTPFVDLDGLDQDELALVIDEQLDLSVSFLADRPAPSRVGRGAAVPAVSDVVEILPARPEPTLTLSSGESRFVEIAKFAISLARRTGRVTNGGLREVFPIDASTAREILTDLVDEGALLRRGEKRGTHYVVADRVAEPGEEPASVLETTSTLRRVLRPADEQERPA